MRYRPIPSVHYEENRENFINFMEPGTLAIFCSAPETTRNSDQLNKYRQDSNLFYLTGIDQAQTTLVLSPDFHDKKMREILFVSQANDKILIWEGHKLSFSQVSKISGIRNIKPNCEIEEILKLLLVDVKKVYCNRITHENQLLFVDDKYQYLKKIFSNPLVDFCSLTEKMKKLRIVKKSDEINQIREASRITEEAFLKVLKTKLVGLKEFQIEAIITGVFNYNGCEHAFHPIVASGENASVLHYIKNDVVCNKDQLLLLDFGAEYGNYAADCSRTIPVSGKFTQRQKDCYNAVLRTFYKARKLFVPGNTINLLNELTDRWMEEEMIGLGLFNDYDVKVQNPAKPLFRNYYMHGVSHFLGLDVHDMGDKNTPFIKGMILTCEPGLYISDEKIGIRIENDILVDDVPVDLMEGIPLESTEIEFIMNMSK